MVIAGSDPGISLRSVLDGPYLTFLILKDAGNFWRRQSRAARSEKWRVSAFDTFDDVAGRAACV